MGPNVLIAWEHGANLGHLARLLPVAHELRAAGRRVIFAIARKEAGQRYLAPAGFEWVVAPTIAAPVTPDPGTPLNHAELLLRCGFAQSVQAHACVLLWQKLFDTFNPASVLVDASPMALYAALAGGVPVVALGHGFEIPPAGQSGPCFSPWIEGAAARAVQAQAQLEQAFARLAQLSGGVRAPRQMEELYPPHLCALCTWPQLDHFDRADDGAGLAYTGPVWGELPGTGAHAWPRREGPKVLCYLNLRDKHHDLMWQALTGSGANVLVISPDGVPRACEAARGWGITVVERPVLLAPLLADCAAVVSHGGMGLTSMALHCAQPLLLLPEHMEQAILAYRLSRQGLAVATIRSRDKTLIQQKVETLLHDRALKNRSGEFASRHSAFQPNLAVARIAGMCLEGSG